MGERRESHGIRTVAAIEGEEADRHEQEVDPVDLGFDLLDHLVCLRQKRHIPLDDFELSTGIHTAQFLDEGGCRGGIAGDNEHAGLDGVLGKLPEGGLANSGRGTQE